jgi:DnaJ-domain-containing protein 1
MGAVRFFSPKKSPASAPSPSLELLDVLGTLRRELEQYRKLGTLRRLTELHALLPKYERLLSRLEEELSAYRQFGSVQALRDRQQQEEERQQAPVPARGDPYTVLGIAPSASQEMIRRAYKQKMLQYHPDRVQHLGPELQAFALQKTFEIQAAVKELGVCDYSAP